MNVIIVELYPLPSGNDWVLSLRFDPYFDWREVYHTELRSSFHHYDGPGSQNEVIVRMQLLMRLIKMTRNLPFYPYLPLSLSLAPSLILCLWRFVLISRSHHERESPPPPNSLSIPFSLPLSLSPASQLESCCTALSWSCLFLSSLPHGLHVIIHELRNSGCTVDIVT